MRVMDFFIAAKANMVFRQTDFQKRKENYGKRFI